MKSIRFKITFGIIVILSLVLLLLGNFTIREQREKMMAQMNDYGTETADFIAQISVTPLQKYSIYQLENYIQQLEKGRLIVFCEIYDNKGNALAHVSGSTIFPEEHSHSGELLVFTSNIADGDLSLGRVELGLNPEPIVARINRTSVYISIALFLELLLVGVALAYFINRSLVTPILKLSKTTGEIARGHFISSSQASRKDEVGILAKSINAMSANLDEYYRNLEHKVAERTAALTNAKNASEATAKNLKIVSNELQVLLDNSPVAIVFISKELIVQRVNLEFSKIYGYRPEEIVGKSSRMLFSSEEDFIDANEKTYNFLEHNENCEATIVMVKKDKSPITCSLRGRLALLDNESEGVIWTIEDITARLKMEMEVYKIKKLESIGVLAGGIAHDFNNILVSILGHITVAEKLSEENPKVLDLLGKSKKASLRAKDLTVKLLTFAKGGDPVKSLETLPEIIEESTSFVLAGSNVQCHYSFDENLWAIPIDKGQINQVIQNLILNADQSMPDGGSITITARNEVLTRNIKPELVEGDYVRLDIADTGDGIDDGVIGNIFDPYFSTKEQSGDRGSGLGLSIVHSIVDKHGGAISVHSDRGVGTTFTLYLPATRAIVKKEKTETTQIKKGKGTILLMDDDATIHAVIKEMLTYLGYDHLHAYTGEEAISMYEEDYKGEKSIDIIIMDLTIPGGMGGEIAVKKVLELNPDAKVLVSSGYSENPIVQNYREAGFVNTISKPYQLLELSKVLAETMQN